MWVLATMFQYQCHRCWSLLSPRHVCRTSKSWGLRWCTLARDTSISWVEIMASLYFAGNSVEGQNQLMQWPMLLVIDKIYPSTCENMASTRDRWVNKSRLWMSSYKWLFQLEIFTYIFTISTYWYWVSNIGFCPSGHHWKGSHVSSSSCRRLFSGKHERHGGMDARKIAGNLSQIVQTPPRWINSLRVSGDIKALPILAEMNPFGKQQEPGTPTITSYFWTVKPTSLRRNQNSTQTG